MRLEYEIATTGRSRFIRDLRTIEQEVDRSARRGLSREQRTEQERGRLRTVGGKKRLSTDETMARRAAAAETQAAKMSATARIREERRVAAEQARLLRWRQNIQNRHFQSQAMLRRREEMAEVRSAQRVAAARGRSAARFGAGAARVATGSLGLIGGGIRAVGGMVGLGGGLAAGMAARNRMGLEASAASLANQAYVEGGPQTREEIQARVQNTADTEGARSGLGSAGIIEALRNVAAMSGRLDIGERLAGYMADVSDATDAGIADVGRTVGQVVQSLSAKGIYSDDEIFEQTKEILASMAGQAKVGSIEFQDLATQMGKVMSATSGYEGKVSDLAATMGAVAQLSLAGGASSPEEAMTAILRFRDDLITNQKKFGKLGDEGGVKVFTDDTRTQVRDPMEILFDMLKASGGDLSKVGSLFGIRAQKAVQPFQEAFTAAGGGDAGIEAVKKILDSVRDTKMSDQELTDSAGFRREQTDKQLSIAWEKLSQEMGKKLVPVITELTPKLVELVPHVGNFIDKLIAFGKAVAPLIESIGGMAMKLIENDPFDGVGVLIGGLLIRQFGSELVSSAVASGMSKIMAVIAGQAAAGAATDMIPGVGGGAAGKAGKAGKMGKYGRLAGGLGLAAGAAGALALGVGLMMDDDDQRMQKIDAEKEHAQSLGLDRYTMATGRTSSAGLDANLQGSPAAIQTMILDAMKAQPGSAEQNNAGAEALLEAAKKQAEVTKSLEATTRNVAAMQSRTSPILQRGG